MIDIICESWAVALRDLKKQTKLWKQILIILGLLVLFILIGKGFDNIINLPSGQTYTYFFTGGIIAYMVALISLNTGMDLVIDKKGFGKLLLVAPISRISILLGKMIFLVIAVVKTYFVMVLLLMLYLKTFIFSGMLLSFFVVICIVMIFLGISFILSAFIKNTKTAETLMGILSMAFLFLSGIIYPANALPKILHFIFYLNPMTYAAEALRFTITRTYTLPPLLTLSVIVTLSIILPSLGVYLYDRFQRK